MPAIITARRGRVVETAPFKLDAHIFYHLSRALGRRNRALNAELRRFDLDFPRWRVLAVLNEHTDCSMLQLAEWTSVDRTTLAHTVRLMEREGLLSRHQRTTDRRSIALALTRRGYDRFNAILPAVQAQNHAGLAGLTASDVKHLQRMLRQIADNLKS